GGRPLCRPEGTLALLDYPDAQGKERGQAQGPAPTRAVEDLSGARREEENMQTQRIDQEQIDSEMYVKARLDFAQRCFTSGQELNRNIDFKANFLITAVGLLTTALGVVA